MRAGLTSESFINSLTEPPAQAPQFASNKNKSITGQPAGRISRAWRRKVMVGTAWYAMQMHKFLSISDSQSSAPLMA